MWSEIERRNLVDTLLASDPFAPTLCEGWQVRHLTTHLYLRRHRPWAIMGSTLARMADAVHSATDLQELTEKFAAPPASWSPLNLMDRTLGDLANLGEYVIHHEDIRRGDGPAPVREFPEPMAAAILRPCRQFARLKLRRVRQGVVLAVPDGPSLIVRTGPDPVTVIGSPADLALLVSGRARAAEISWTGPAGPVRAAFGAE